MKDEITSITLFCVNCNEETPHTVQYIGSYLRSVSCDKCTRKIEIDRRHLRTVFAEDFIDRILTKPHRINEDMKKAFATLLPFFPKRLFLEPLQVFREIYGILKKNENKKISKSRVPADDKKQTETADADTGKVNVKRADTKHADTGKADAKKADANQAFTEKGKK